jgi:hypothetical protein
LSFLESVDWHSYFVSLLTPQFQNSGRKKKSSQAILFSSSRSQLHTSSDSELQDAISAAPRILYLRFVTHRQKEGIYILTLTL